jgi:LPXTG-motif cell wall-anchored protein
VSDSGIQTSSVDPSASVDDGAISASSGIGGTLARTGADPGIFLLVGGGLIVAGILILRYRVRLA